MLLLALLGRSLPFPSSKYFNLLLVEFEQINPTDHNDGDGDAGNDAI